MQRNMDLIRQIMFKLEGDIDFHPRTYNFFTINEKIEIGGYSDEEVYGIQHSTLMSAS